MSYEGSIAVAKRVPTDKLGQAWLQRRTHMKIIPGVVWMDYFVEHLNGPDPRFFVKTLPWGCIRDLIFGMHPLVTDLGSAGEVARFLMSEGEERWGLRGEPLDLFLRICEQVMCDLKSFEPVEPLRPEWDPADDMRIALA